MVQQRDPVCSTSCDTIGRATAGECRLRVGELASRADRSRARDNRPEGASIDVDDRSLVLYVSIYSVECLFICGRVKDSV